MDWLLYDNGPRLERLKEIKQGSGNMTTPETYLEPSRTYTMEFF